MGLLIGIGNTSPKNPYNQWYGVKIAKGSVSSESQRVTRINGDGAASLHASLPIQSAMKRCILKDDGTVNYYLHYADSTKKDSGAAAVLDGTDGQIMVEIPDTYFKFEEDSTYYYVMMSQQALPGFTLWRKKYVSAVEATVQQSGNKLSSVINWASGFAGGSGSATASNANMLGRPRTSLSLANFRTYAHNRGTGWQCNTYEVQKHLWWLFVVEYATLNSQAAFNATLTAEGYHQGGLGNGVSTLDSSKWGAYSGYNPVVPCGVTVKGFSDNDDANTQATLSTNILGNASGEAAYTLKAGTYAATDTVVYVNSYRGVENPFAHIWKWTDGILVRYEDSDYDNQCILYVSDDPTQYASSLNSSYKAIGPLPLESTGDGYVKEICFGATGDIMPKKLGGSSTTYFCDYYYHNTSTQAANTVHGVFFGGNAADGALCGFLSAHTYRAPSYARATIGSRLCFIPATA